MTTRGWLAALLAAVALLVLPAAAGAGKVPAFAVDTSPTTTTNAAAGIAPSNPITATGTASSAAPQTTVIINGPNALRSPPSISIPPPGYRLSAQSALALAKSLPKIKSVLHNHRGSYPYAYMKGSNEWQVSVFAGKKGGELAQVTIFDPTSQVLEAWTGYQVAWTMARGYKGAFGRSVNAVYIWLPLCALFVLPFVPRRRRSWWLFADALALVGFSISLAFFNHANVGLSAPLAYPFLLYLFARMLMIGFKWRDGERTEPLPLLVPVSWLAVGLVFLVGFRVGLNLTNSNVVDVGYAGVIGAHRILTGAHLYGVWPNDNFYGDTYGPVNYYAYIPFVKLWPWSGVWDNLASAHAAAIAFDTLTMLGLFVLGRRIRNATLGIVLAYAWAAYPFTLYVMNTNSNDSIVAMTLVWTLVVASSPPARGAMLAISGLAKFVPLTLAPLFLRTPTGIGNPRPRSPRATFVTFALGFGVAAAVVMAPIVLGGDLHVFWEHTIKRQADRVAPFSIWGLWGGDWKILQHALQVVAFLFAILVGFFPRRRSVTQLAALGAAVMLAFQIGVVYWFYLYIVWFFPFLMVALLGRYGAPPSAEEAPASAEAVRSGDQQLLDPVSA
jgi:hypothetical protein